ncbi:MAG TPA: VOC family protein [Chitinophagaceae bacterium]|nr:VOC family protein [Chitinophagaceae bacterium]
MDSIGTKTSVDLQFTQIAWVVKDIKAAERFFKEAIGLDSFSKTSISRLNEYEATYYGEQCDAENLVSLAYTGETFVELIQPVSGRSIFQDYLDKNPAGGVQHIAFSVPVRDLEKVTSELTEKGYPVISTFNTPIAIIIFFDTTKDIGVLTEIMGITEEGEKVVQKMKTGKIEIEK